LLGSEASVQPGTVVLGRYRVLHPISVDRLASVYLAHVDAENGGQKQVALRRLHPHLFQEIDPIFDMQFDEARLIVGFKHANVARIIELGSDATTYWIAMEYLQGETLREVMRRADERGVRLSREFAARICSDVAEGLHAGHELRARNGQPLDLVHREITPDNIFLTNDGHTKILDFGIVKVLANFATRDPFSLNGRLASMSPEQLRGAEVDRTTDIFALGVVLWELTTSQRLFRVDTELHTLEKLLACIVPPPSSLIADYPTELESVVMRALAKRKQDRFQTARALADALQAFLRHQRSR
jgi:serine/threonine protein kinase